MIVNTPNLSHISRQLVEIIKCEQPGHFELKLRRKKSSKTTHPKEEGFPSPNSSVNDTGRTIPPKNRNLF